MPPDGITTAEIGSGRAVTQPLKTKIKDWIDYLYGQSISASKVPNGSFEIDSDADGVPDQWDKDLYAGGTFSLQDADDDTSIHGAACAKFTHPGGASNGGGNLTSDYMEVQEGRDLTAGWAIKVSATGAKNQVVLRYFDEDKVDLSADDTLYSNTSGPTSWTAMSSTSTPPANGRFCKIKLIGGFTDTDPGAARDTYFDDVWLKEGALNIIELTTAETSSIVAPSSDLFVTLQAGGGSGGSTRGSGGCSGGYIENYHFETTVGASLNYRVGVGGAPGTAGTDGNTGETTYLGSLIVLGGYKGIYDSTAKGAFYNSQPGYRTGGSGGAESGTDGDPSNRFVGGAAATSAGGGGASEFGIGGAGGTAAGSAPASTSYGAGGGGGGASSPWTGGSGAKGMIRIVWFG